MSLIGGIRAYAHRGGAAEAPENSLAAFRRAVDLGFVDLETDVRATRDGVCVVHHDARLDRTTDAVGLIREQPWRSVRRARILGREPLSRLEDLLEALPGVHVTIDIKESAAIAPLADAIARTRAHRRVTVASFSAARSAAVRAALGVPTTAAPVHVALLRLPLRGPGPDPVAYQVPERLGRYHLLTDRLVRAAHHRGSEVHVWTVNDRAGMQRCLDLGVDGIMTDRPSLLRQVLAEQGAWPPAPPPG